MGVGQACWVARVSPGLAYHIRGSGVMESTAAPLGRAQPQPTERKMGLPRSGCGCAPGIPLSTALQGWAKWVSRCRGGLWAAGGWRGVFFLQPQREEKRRELPPSLRPPLAPPCPRAGCVLHPTTCQQPLICSAKEVKPGQGASGARGASPRRHLQETGRRWVSSQRSVCRNVPAAQWRPLGKFFAHEEWGW